MPILKVYLWSDGLFVCPDCVDSTPLDASFFVATERAQIIRLIHQLRDPHTAQRAHQQLVARGSRSVLLELMRFVYDARHTPQAGVARGLAMQAILDIGGPEDQARLFEFLCAMRHDPDELVRTYIVEGFSTLQDARALDYVREALSDTSLFVRERARQAFSALQTRQRIHPLELRADDFLHELTQASPARRALFARWLPEHRDAFALASALVRRDDAHTELGIQTLHTLQNPAARNVALRHFRLTRSDADRAASLRLMAEFLQADASPEEVRGIEDGLVHGDGFVQLAAIEAAGRSGHEALMCRALGATRAENTIIAATAAAGLCAVAEHLPDWMAPGVLKSVHTVRARRRHAPNANLLQAEAALLQTLAELYPPRHPQVRLAQQVVLDSLRDSQQFKPITQACLHALERLTPPEGYPQQSRWHPGDACVLVPLLDRGDPGIQQRALELIRRAAPGDTPNLSQAFERLLEASAPGHPPLLVSAITETNAPGARARLARRMQAQEPRDAAR